ncbi:MAG: copper homeostasis protein CutC [Calditrichaeota bacterium]|nr:MAG: copper homeostasis protein CutC [Calditrichota bacterium]
MKLEVCCYSAESALIAEKSGANRIELCDNFLEGGTTPSYSTIEFTVKNLKIPVNVIIRPRGGDFLYSEIEYQIIKRDILQAKKLGANGVVTGFLKSNGEIDFRRTEEVVGLAKPMEVTFHRAFDMCKIRCWLYRN